METESFESRIGVAEASAESVRLQIARSGSALYGIATAEISAIVARQNPTPLPNAPQAVLGVVSIHGCMFTVLHLAELTSDNAAVRDSAQHIIALRGDEQLALAVDEVGEVVEVGLKEIAAADGFIAGRVTRDDVQINILDLKGLFSTAIQGRERRRRRF
jgi:chemotaxis signal transduction protein